jgi:putative molybdopterin biosynthesis protein
MPITGNDVAMLHLSIGYKFSKEPTFNRLEHPLLEVLESVYETGSIGKAAKHLGRSYRHVWGELKHWESELNADLIVWGKSGKGAELTPQAIAFLVAVSKTQVDLAPQVAHIKNCFQQCVTVLQMPHATHGA